MKVNTNLRKFISKDVAGSKYRYRMSNTRLMRVLLGNGLYDAYSKEIVSKVRRLHDHICSELMVVPIPASQWRSMKRRVNKIAKSVRHRERMFVTVIFEVDNFYELSIELRTFIK